MYLMWEWKKKISTKVCDANIVLISIDQIMQQSDCFELSFSRRVAQRVLFLQVPNDGIRIKKRT